MSQESSAFTAPNINSLSVDVVVLSVYNRVQKMLKIHFNFNTKIQTLLRYVFYFSRKKLLLGMF